MKPKLWFCVAKLWFGFGKCVCVVTTEGWTTKLVSCGFCQPIVHYNKPPTVLFSLQQLLSNWSTHSPLTDARRLDVTMAKSSVTCLATSPAKFKLWNFPNAELSLLYLCVLALYAFMYRIIWHKYRVAHKKRPELSHGIMQQRNQNESTE